jgi:hypothetical protein
MSRITPAITPVAIPAMLPVACCCSGETTPPCGAAVAEGVEVEVRSVVGGGGCILGDAVGRKVGSVVGCDVDCGVGCDVGSAVFDSALWDCDELSEGAFVGIRDSDVLVASNCCVTLLNPSSMLDATSLGKADSSTDSAFVVDDSVAMILYEVQLQNNPR